MGLKKSLLFFCLFVFAFAKAQQETPKPKRQFSLQHDNDFLLGIDRYYTAGTFIGYSQALSGDFIFKNSQDASLQLDVVLGQETYTPRELFETDFELLERPYAGYLFVSGAVTKAKKNSLWELGAELGLAGPQSLAGAAQIAYHRLINEFIPTWAGQIENGIHINGAIGFTQSFQKEKNIFLDLQSQVALGTRQLFAEQQAVVFIGDRAAVASSSFYNRIGATSELYGYAGLLYRYVALNALIQGHPFGDDSPFTLPIENSVYGGKAGIVYRKAANTLQLEYVTQSNETRREGQLQFTSLIYKRAF